MDNLSDLRNSKESHDQEQLSTKKEHHTCSFSRLSAVDELGSVLHDTLQLKDEISSAGSDLSSDECDVNLDASMETYGKCLDKSASFPVAESENSPCTYLLSLPTTHNLISAMKGSREKEGLPSRKLSVSWAPDVYDPPPTSLSHYPKKKILLQYTKSNKKHGKGKQKGKTMKGGGSGPKDKKHYRKIGGKSDRCLDSYSDTDRVMSSKNYRSSAELLDFDDDYDDDDVNGHESNSGSSYRGKAGGHVHFSYAETT